MQGFADRGLFTSSQFDQNFSRLFVIFLVHFLDVQGTAHPDLGLPLIPAEIGDAIMPILLPGSLYGVLILAAHALGIFPFLILAITEIQQVALDAVHVNAFLGIVIVKLSAILDQPAAPA